ncbi:hypothetical protein D9M68_908120 [compost metagenome]
MKLDQLVAQEQRAVLHHQEEHEATGERGHGQSVQAGGPGHALAQHREVRTKQDGEKHGKDE